MLFVYIGYLESEEYQVSVYEEKLLLIRNVTWKEGYPEVPYIQGNGDGHGKANKHTPLSPMLSLLKFIKSYLCSSSEPCPSLYATSCCNIYLEKFRLIYLQRNFNYFGHMESGGVPVFIIRVNLMGANTSMVYTVLDNIFVIRPKQAGLLWFDVFCYCSTQKSSRLNCGSARSQSADYLGLNYVICRHNMAGITSTIIYCMVYICICTSRGQINIWLNT